MTTPATSRVPFADDGDLEGARNLAKGITLPARPKVVMDLSREMSKPEPSFDQVLKLVGADPSLTAKLLRVINSPLYGLPRKVESVRHALTLLGLRNFSRVVLATALREAVMGGKNTGNERQLEEFWTYTMAVARITEFLVVRNPVFAELVSPDQAYLVGLFHDCAVPVFIKKYADYATVLEQAKGMQQNVFDAEEARYGSYHGAIGYLITRSWELPSPVCQAIRYHHHYHLSASGIDEVAAMEVLPLYEVLRLGNFLGEHLLEVKGQGVTGCYRDPQEFLVHVNLTEQELEDLKEDVVKAITL